MSEEQIKSGEGPAETEDDQKAPPNGGVSDSGVKEGTGFVDFSKLPEELRAEIEPRFKRIYGNMKEYERSIAVLQEHNARLAETLEKFVNEQNSAKAKDQAETVRKQVAGLLEEGKFEEAADLMLKAKIEPPKPVNLKPAKPATPDGAGLTQEDVAAVQAWTHERNPDGTLKRPWAQQGHPKQRRVAGLASSLLEDPDWQHQPMEAVLREVDRLMGIGPAQAASKPGAAAVLTPDGAGKRKSGAPELTEAQKAVARKLFRGDPKAEEKYSKQLKLMGAA